MRVSEKTGWVVGRVVVVVPAGAQFLESFPHHPPPLPHCRPLLPPTDELLEQFLESFPEESAQVQLQLMTATVKLFLKKPTEKPQQLIQLVLTYATQVG